MFPSLLHTVIPLHLLVLAVAAQDSVSFFYSPLLDSCEWGASNTFQATNNTANGGLCAFIPSRNRLYACPAPDPTCWAWNQNCNGGTNTPSSDQILCGASNNYQWCCASDETCTQTPGQINVCISAFASPNKGVSPADAQRAEFGALPSSAIGTKIPQATPTAFTTLKLGTAAASSSSSSSSASKSTAASSASAPATASSSSSTPESRRASGGLSGGVIAGIIIGVIAGIALVCGTIAFLVVHKRRRESTAAAAGIAQGGALEQQQQQRMAGYPHNQQYYGMEVNAKVADAPPQELPVQEQRRELP